jgi:protein tyrosine phosphatase
MGKFLLTILPILFFFQQLSGQITLKNKVNGKELKIETNERVKLTYYQSKWEMKGLYQFVFYGRGKNSKFGKLVAYTDKTLTVRYGPLRKKHEIPIDAIQSITSYNLAARYSTNILSVSGTIATMAILSANTPIFLVCSAGLIMTGGFFALDEFVLFPNKKVKGGDWVLVVNEENKFESVEITSGSVEEANDLGENE